MISLYIASTQMLDVGWNHIGLYVQSARNFLESKGAKIEDNSPNNWCRFGGKNRKMDFDPVFRDLKTERDTSLTPLI